MCEQNIKSHPGTAAVLSFLFNGLGHLYNGQISKGLKIIFVSFLSMLILIIGSAIIAFWLLGTTMPFSMLVYGIALFVAGGGLVCALGLYSVYDAYKSALK